MRGTDRGIPACGERCDGDAGVCAGVGFVDAIDFYF